MLCRCCRCCHYSVAGAALYNPKSELQELEAARLPSCKTTWKQRKHPKINKITLSSRSLPTPPPPPQPISFFFPPVFLGSSNPTPPHFLFYTCPTPDTKTQITHLLPKNISLSLSLSLSLSTLCQLQLFSKQKIPKNTKQHNCCAAIAAATLLLDSLLVFSCLFFSLSFFWLLLCCQFDDGGIQLTKVVWDPV
jgi:hypothetical protein